jgi:hypothetical protein
MENAAWEPAGNAQELCLRLRPSARSEPVVQWRLIAQPRSWCVLAGDGCVYDYGAADSLEDARLHAEGALFDLLEQLRMQLASREL